MRLWHYKLIQTLPRQQLLGQWRECCLIAKNIAERGTPNHILVNPVMDYPKTHFITYSRLVFEEMNRRDYNVHSNAFTAHVSEPFCEWVHPNDLFPDWHTDSYFQQCYYNLQEKHDRGGITDEEWLRIQDVYNAVTLNKENDCNERLVK